MEHKISISNLTDDQLNILYNEGHLDELTKNIQELSFFYNRVEEEIKRRNLKKNYEKN